jgi:hypothetical protein
MSAAWVVECKNVVGRETQCLLRALKHCKVESNKNPSRRAVKERANTKQGADVLTLNVEGEARWIEDKL